MKKILKKHIHEPLPESLRPKKSNLGWPIFASSMALVFMIMISFQITTKQSPTVTDKWWTDFDQELDQEMELVLAELEEI